MAMALTTLLGNPPTPPPSPLPCTVPVSESLLQPRASLTQHRVPGWSRRQKEGFETDKAAAPSYIL